MSRGSGDLIGAAELRRRFGWPSAFGATTYNELKGQEDGQPFSSDWMDMENDRIGFRIGAQARTFADVVNLAQHAIAEAIATAGKDRRGPIWRDPRFWGDDPGRQFGRLEDWVPSGPQPEGYSSLRGRNIAFSPTRSPPAKQKPRHFPGPRKRR